MAFAAIGKALQLCDGCLEVYRKSLPSGDDLAAIHQRVQDLQVNLIALQNALEDHDGIAEANPNVTKHLMGLLDSTQDELRHVRHILIEHDTARQDWMDRITYTVTNRSKELGSEIRRLDELAERIEKAQSTLQTSLLVKLASKLNISGDASRLGTPPPYKPKRAPPSHGQQRMARTKSRTSNMTVVFIDEYNETWSVVASAYVKILSAYMQQFPGSSWPIGQCHSVGALVEPDATTAISLQPYQEYIVSGAHGPNPMAVATLFNDQFTEDIPGKELLQAHTINRLTRGLYGNIFDDSDYIFTFDQGTANLLEQLRVSWGKQDSPAKLALLGKYWPSPETGRDIIQPSPAEMADPMQAQQMWTRTVSRIKVCVKLWLNRDFGWSEPSGMECATADEEV